MRGNDIWKWIWNSLVRFGVHFLQLFVLPIVHLSSDAVKVKANLENLKALKIVGEGKPLASGAEKGRLNRHISSSLITNNSTLLLNQLGSLLFIGMQVILKELHGNSPISFLSFLWLLFLHHFVSSPSISIASHTQNYHWLLVCGGICWCSVAKAHCVCTDPRWYTLSHPLDLNLLFLRMNGRCTSQMQRWEDVAARPNLSLTFLKWQRQPLAAVPAKYLQLALCAKNASHSLPCICCNDSSQMWVLEENRKG